MITTGSPSSSPIANFQGQGLQAPPATPLPARPQLPRLRRVLPFAAESRSSGCERSETTTASKAGSRQTDPASDRPRSRPPVPRPRRPSPNPSCEHSSDAGSAVAWTRFLGTPGNGRRQGLRQRRTDPSPSSLRNLFRFFFFSPVGASLTCLNQAPQAAVYIGAPRV